MNKIMFLGIGRGGCQVIDRMRRVTGYGNIRNARYVFVDCDSHDLNRYKGYRNILMDRGSFEFPSDVFAEMDQLILVAGMSGFAGSEFLSPTATAALSAGIKSVSVVGMLGFLWEGNGRFFRSLTCLDKIKKTPGISLEIYNMGSIADKYGKIDALSALEKADKEIIAIIEEKIQIKAEGYDWNGYSIIGDRHELNKLINEIDSNKIDEYDILNTLLLNGNNSVATGEGNDFGVALKQAVDNLSLIKTENLLLRFSCGCRLPSISELALISPLLSKAGVSDKAHVKLDIVQDNKLGNLFKVLIVASREYTHQVSTGTFNTDAQNKSLSKQIFSLRNNLFRKNIEG